MMKMVRGYNEVYSFSLHHAFTIGQYLPQGGENLFLDLEQRQNILLFLCIKHRYP